MIFNYLERWMFIFHLHGGKTLNRSSHRSDSNSGVNSNTYWQWGFRLKTNPRCCLPGTPNPAIIVGNCDTLSSQMEPWAFSSLTSLTADFPRIHLPSRPFSSLHHFFTSGNLKIEPISLNTPILSLSLDNSTTCFRNTSNPSYWSLASPSCKIFI